MKNLNALLFSSFCAILVLFNYCLWILKPYTEPFKPNGTNCHRLMVLNRFSYLSQYVLKLFSTNL